MDTIDYWKECISIAADECGLTMTDEQLKCLADSVEAGHENYGMAYYSPPASDRISVIEREAADKVAEARAEADRIRGDYIKNICLRHRCDPADVTLEGNGHASIRQ